MNSRELGLTLQSVSKHFDLSTWPERLKNGPLGHTTAARRSPNSPFTLPGELRAGTEPHSFAELPLLCIFQAICICYLTTLPSPLHSRLNLQLQRKSPSCRYVSIFLNAAKIHHQSCRQPICLCVPELKTNSSHPQGGRGPTSGAWLAECRPGQPQEPLPTVALCNRSLQIRPQKP